MKSALALPLSHFHPLIVEMDYELRGLGRDLALSHCDWVERLYIHHKYTIVSGCSKKMEQLFQDDIQIIFGCV